MTDERLWELWRQAQEDCTVEVDLAFGRLVAEEAVKQERERCAALVMDIGGWGRGKIAAAIQEMP